MGYFICVLCGVCFFNFYKMRRLKFIDSWTVYISLVKDEITSTLVNVGLMDHAPLEKLGNLLWIRVHMHTPDGNGLCSDKENDVLCKIEDFIDKHIHHELKCLMVGSQTQKGCRNFYFYAKEENYIKKHIKSLKVHFADYFFEEGGKKDVEWGFFRYGLFPSDEEQQKLFNFQTVDELEKSGDILNQEREVDHWVYFESQEDRSGFEQRIRFHKYQVRQILDPIFEEDFPYGLQIFRNEIPRIPEIDVSTTFLIKLSKQFKGRYDGWETFIIDG